VFISLEGPDGSGKSTQAELLAGQLREAGREVVLTQEPGGTALGAQIRSILLRSDGSPIEPRAEALLFAASRAQLMNEVILPALADGADVVVDRFTDSTLAYQGGGRGLPMDELRELIAIATQGGRPEITLLLDVPPPVGLARCHGAAHWTRFESETLAFHDRVRQTYLDLAQAEPARWIVLDACRTVPEIAADIWAAIRARLTMTASSPADTEGRQEAAATIGGRARSIREAGD